MNAFLLLAGSFESYEPLEPSRGWEGWQGLLIVLAFWAVVGLVFYVRHESAKRAHERIYGKPDYSWMKPERRAEILRDQAEAAKQRQLDDIDRLTTAPYSYLPWAEEDA